MQLYLDECLSYKKLSEEISIPNVHFYFAKYANIIIGYLKINIGEAQTELPDGNGLEVERIYVLKEYQGKKIGQYLFDKALQITKEYKLYFLWLGVWEKNIKAINFYKRNGLIEFGSHVFKLGNDEQIDILMKVNLQ